ncbi:MAG TPA: LPD7 domain-containing protein [Rhodanobacteraceae bacterium]|nr:LPD7 domain-containing protein [Rhodanobacteraceae bacterium]
MSNEAPELPEGGRAPNKRPLNEIRRIGGEKGSPDRTIPEHLKPHYHQDGNAFRSAYRPDRIEFVDRGSRMHAYFPISTFTVRALAEIAVARGWKELEVTGSQDFQRSAYVEAATRGLKVRGYEPTEKDLEILQRRSERREAEKNPLVQAFLAAESKKDQESAIKKYPQLKAAFLADAAAKAIAEAKIDSKKAAENFVSRFRDSIAIALHTGRALPAPEVKAEPARPSKIEERNRDRSR